MQETKENIILINSIPHHLFGKTIKCLLFVMTVGQLIVCICFGVYSQSDGQYSDNQQVLIAVLFALALLTLYALYKANAILLALIQVVLTVVSVCDKWVWPCSIL